MDANVRENLRENVGCRFLSLRQLRVPSRRVKSSQDSHLGLQLVGALDTPWGTLVDRNHRCNR
jgi:hypothetical protein